MQFNKFFAATVAACGFFVAASQAHAGTTVLGAGVSLIDAQDPSDAGLGYFDSAVFDFSAETKPFVLQIDFESNGSIDGLGLYKVVAGGYEYVSPFTSVSYGSSAAWIYKDLPTSSGQQYVAEALGRTGDTVSLSYATTAVATVPEPGSTALLFAGLGVVGIVHSRRRAV